MNSYISGNQGRTLFVAYPLLPVSECSAGGAEQVLWNLQRELVARGQRITVAACAGTDVSAPVYSTGSPASGSLSSARMHESRHTTNCLELLRVREAVGTGFNLVHDHSGSFFTQARKISSNIPLLVTLHLPRSFYPQEYFRHTPANVYFNCVSKTQARSFEDLPNMLGHVDNGVDLERLSPALKKEEYVLWLGRICEEKGTHIAMDAAERAGVPIVIAGTVYPFSYHQSYFDRIIAPRLERMGGKARFVEMPDFAAKLRLLQNARAVILSSTAEETSSLVAMEAAACGTPVIALRNGALPEIVRQGTTGLLVRSKEEIAGALAKVGSIEPRHCRDHAEKHFSSARMADDYQRLYARILKLTVPTRHEEYQPLAA